MNDESATRAPSAEPKETLPQQADGRVLRHESGEPVLVEEPALLVRRLEVLAADVGRLRRSLRAALDAADAIASHVEVIDTYAQATAADFYRGNLALGAGEDTAVREALATVDERSRHIHRLLGGDRT